MYRIKIIVLFVLSMVLLLTASISSTPAKASSADITLSSDTAVVNVGDTFNVNIDIEAEVLPGDFEAYILYPKDNLEFVPGVLDIIAGGEGIIRITDHVTAAYSNHRKYSIKFRAKARGEAVISFRDGPELYELEEGYLMSVSANEIKISVLAAKNASSDSTLAILKINPGKLEPEFAADIREYHVTVPYETNRLTVSALATDRNAEVSVFGNTELKEGDNRIEIKVTAENGDEGIYAIICEKESLKEDQKPEEKKSSDTDETEKKQDQTGENDDHKKNDPEDDPEEKEYVVKPEQEGTKALTDSIEALELMESYEKSLSTMTLIIALLSALSMALLIIVIRLATRKGNDELDD